MISQKKCGPQEEDFSEDDNRQSSVEKSQSPETDEIGDFRQEFSEQVAHFSASSQTDIPQQKSFKEKESGVRRKDQGPRTEAQKVLYHLTAELFGPLKPEPSQEEKEEIKKNFAKTVLLLQHFLQYDIFEKIVKARFRLSGSCKKNWAHYLASQQYELDADQAEKDASIWNNPPDSVRDSVAIERVARKLFPGKPELHEAWLFVKNYQNRQDAAEDLKKKPPNPTSSDSYTSKYIRLESNENFFELVEDVAKDPRIFFSPHFPNGARLPFILEAYWLELSGKKMWIEGYPVSGLSRRGQHGIMYTPGMSIKASAMFHWYDERAKIENNPLIFQPFFDWQIQPSFADVVSFLRDVEGVSNLIYLEKVGAELQQRLTTSNLIKAIIADVGRMNALEFARLIVAQEGLREGYRAVQKFSRLLAENWIFLSFCVTESSPFVQIAQIVQKETGIPCCINLAEKIIDNGKQHATNVICFSTKNLADAMQQTKLEVVFSQLRKISTFQKNQGRPVTFLEIDKIISAQ
jgi:hypothetical protein